MASSSSYQPIEPRNADSSRDSIESTSTTSLILERINQNAARNGNTSQHKTTYDGDLPMHDGDGDDHEHDDDDDLEAGGSGEKLLPKPTGPNVKKMVYIVGSLLVGAWVLALSVYLVSEYNQTHHTADAGQASNAPSHKNGKLVKLDDIMSGEWRPYRHSIEWVSGVDGKRDGLMLVEDYENNRGWLVVEDLRADENTEPLVLMKSKGFSAGQRYLYANKVWPSPDMKKVLVATHAEHKFRHSFTAKYWIYDVESEEAVPLIPKEPDATCNLAVWSPSSDAIAFVMGNNVYIRRFPEEIVLQVTKDGGKELFYGIPDWVYEEEVFSGNQAMWWSNDGTYLAFLRTNETKVPEFPVQFFFSRPSGEEPEPGLETYPEVEQIKYPKAGAPNPVVEVLFWDMNKLEVVKVQIENDFPDDQRLITEVLWARDKVLIRETNRESDVLKMVMVDLTVRRGSVVREQDVAALDGGWFEVVSISPLY